MSKASFNQESRRAIIRNNTAKIRDLFAVSHCREDFVSLCKNQLPPHDNFFHEIYEILKEAKND